MFLECSLIGKELHSHTYCTNTHLFKKFIAKFIARMVVLKASRKMTSLRSEVKMGL